MSADALRATISGVEILSLAAVGTIPGVVVRQAAARNAPGVGRMRTNAAGNAIAWRAPGSDTWGPWVAVADGECVLEDGSDVNKFVRVEIYPDYIVGGAEAEVHLGDRYANGIGGDDVTAEEAEAGDVVTWSVTLANSGESTLTSLVAWLDASVDDLELSADGSTWSAPSTESAGLALADIPAGESITLHLRRTITAGATSDPAVLNWIHFRFDQ